MKDIIQRCINILLDEQKYNTGKDQSQMNAARHIK